MQIADYKLYYSPFADLSLSYCYVYGNLVFKGVPHQHFKDVDFPVPLCCFLVRCFLSCVCWCVFEVYVILCVYLSDCMSVFLSIPPSLSMDGGSLLTAIRFLVWNKVWVYIIKPILNIYFRMSYKNNTPVRVSGNGATSLYVGATTSRNVRRSVQARET